MMRTLLILLLLLPVCLADAGLESRSGYETGDSVTVDGITYDLIISQKTDSLALDANGTLITLHASDCFETERQMLCFDSKPDNSTATLALYNLEAEIIASMYQNDSALWIGDTRKINVTIRNDGNAQAKTLKFLAKVPEEFEITENFRCKVAGNKITWNGALDAEQSYSFYYTIRANVNGSFMVDSDLTFINTDGAEEIEIDDYEIDVGIPFNLSFNISGTNISISDFLNFSINITNNMTKNLTIREVSLLTSDSLNRTDPLPLGFTKKTMSFSTKLDFNESLYADANYQATDSYSGDLDLLLRYVYEGNEYRFSYPFPVSIHKPSLEFSARFDKKEYFPGDEAAIFFTWTNSTMEFSDPLVRITAFNNSELVRLDDETNNVSLTLPERTGFENVKFDFQYKDKFGNLYADSFFKNIKIGSYGKPTLEKEVVYLNESSPVLQVRIINTIGLKMSFTLLEQNDYGEIEETFDLEDGEERTFNISIGINGGASNTALYYTLDGKQTVTQSYELPILRVDEDKNSTIINDSAAMKDPQGVLILPIALGIVGAIVFAGLIIGAFALYKHRKPKAAPVSTKAKKIKEEINDYYALIDKKQKLEEEIDALLQNTPVDIEQSRTLEEEYLELSKQIQKMEQEKLSKGEIEHENKES